MSRLQSLVPASQPRHMPGDKRVAWHVAPRTRLPDSCTSCIAHRPGSRQHAGRYCRLKILIGLIWPGRQVMVSCMHKIEPGLLTPGRGAPVRDGVVVLDGARISYAGPAATAPAAPGASLSRAAVVMPGMWDCHVHFFGARTFD